MIVGARVLLFFWASPVSVLLKRFCPQMGVGEIAAGVCCQHDVDADRAQDREA